MAVLFGVALNAVGKSAPRSWTVSTGSPQIVFKVLNFIMKAAPLGAFGAMAYAIGKYGVSTLTSLGSLILLVLRHLGPLRLRRPRLGDGLPAAEHLPLLRYLREELLLILGTSTAEPALPGLMRKMEYAGVSKPTVGLVVPTGYSFNLDGAAIYLSLAALYIAQATNTDLSIGQQLGLLAVMLLTSKGAAGVAGGGFIALTATLSTAGHHPGHRHHADLRHRQVHVRVPGPGELLRQRGRHPVHRQLEQDLDVDRARAVFAGKDVEPLFDPSEDLDVNPYDSRDHELVRANHGQLAMAGAAAPSSVLEAVSTNGSSVGG